MEIIQVVGIGLIATVLILVVREQKPVFAYLLAAFTGLFIFLFVIGKIEAVIDVLEQLAGRAGIPSIYLKTILKIIGIAYIAEFGAQIIRDAGLDSIASKVEFAGKVLILVMAVPIISVIVETVIGLLPSGGGSG
ncbi:stage III sporulation protein AD [Paenibacillus thailandensis]|uniref:Stage III sporulation protein AD n=1 Tax=Paenibacillus thailandensis TaxID=393250 RepID=A0ABW5QZ47_9BACL